MANLQGVRTNFLAATIYVIHSNNRPQLYCPKRRSVILHQWPHHSICVDISLTTLLPMVGNKQK